MDPREQKLQGIIEVGSKSVQSALHSIHEEFSRRKDLLVKPSALDYELDETGNIFPLIKKERFHLTDHSRSQIFQRTGIPQNFFQKLVEYQEIKLARQNLMTMTLKTMAEGALVRRVDTLIKGWLSPSYKRMDASPVMESFVDACMKNNFKPYVGRNTDYRYQLTFIFPSVIHPTPNEYIVFGVSLVTGDYGGQALELNLVILRISCTNLAMGYDMIRKIHLGSRFVTGEETLELSQNTYDLDNRTVSSAVKDIVKNSTHHVKLLEEKVKLNAQREIKDVEPYMDMIRKQGVKKEITDKIKTMYESEVGELLPEGNSVWRLSNAISLLANSEKNQDTKIDMERAAMAILAKK